MPVTPAAGLAAGQGTGIEELPSAVSEISAAIPRANAELLESSWGQLLHPGAGPRGSLVLRNISFLWNLVLRREGNRIVFFFRKKKKKELVLDSKIKLRIDPSPATDRTELDAPGDVAYRIVPPPFVMFRPSAQELKEFGPSGANASNTILLRVGDSGGAVLGIMNPRAKPKKVGIRLTPPGPPDIERSGGRWPLRPFIELTEAIQKWLRATGSSEVPEVAMTPPGPDDVHEPRRVLYYLVTSYCAAVAELKQAARARAQEQGLSSLVTTDFDVNDFAGHVNLRLKEDGGLAPKSARDSFLLRMGFDVQRRSARPVARVELNPPDFLVSGALHDQFLVALEESELLTEEASQFIRDNWAKATVFRTKRRPVWDTNIIVAPGMHGGHPYVILMSGWFKVLQPSADSWQVTLRKASFDAFYSGPPSPANPVLDRNTVKFFFQLIAAIKDWIDAIEPEGTNSA